MQTFTAADWIANYRVSKETYLYICDKLRPIIQRQDTRMRHAITVEQRVAVTLWCLATCGEYRTIGHLFGIARNTVCVIVHDTCAAIIQVLRSQYISFPAGEDLKNVVERFKAKWDIPQCAGAIDGSHIPVKPPANNHTDYFNRKGWYSVLLQAVVDDEYLFRDVVIGWPGSVHDARVLANSQVYHKAKNKDILNTGSTVICGSVVYPFLVGDSAYPLNTWLIKPFPHNSVLTSKQRKFNYLISRARIVSENAFGRLKARWRRLLKQNDMDVFNVPRVVLACCILHNICEIHGDTFSTVWLDTMTDDQPATIAINTHTSQNTSPAVIIRDKLVQYMT